MSRAALLVLSLAASFAASGCALRASAPPQRQPAITVPALTPLAPLVSQEANVQVPRPARDSIHRAAEQLTVRVRNVNCEGITLGSGFAIAPDVLVTNRHVLAGADELTINTWSGESLAVTTAEVGALGDLGIATVNGKLPTVARYGPAAQAGDPITVVGYPLGGALTFEDGIVVDRADGTRFGIDGELLRVTAQVEHGNSGGPILDTSGRVVGVVFAIEIATGFGLAIPTETVVSLERAGGFETPPPCGSP
jgi:S1-C subfamily serine protease